MIPWVRERLADGRARWQNRKQRNQFNDTDKIVSADGDLISSQEHEQQLSVESRSGRGSANRWVIYNNKLLGISFHSLNGFCYFSQPP